MPTIFCILNSLKFASYPHLRIILVNVLAAVLQSSSDLAPVTIIFPVLKTKAVVFGSLRRIVTALNRLGLYCVFLHIAARISRSTFTPRFTVETTFLMDGSTVIQLVQ